MYLSATVKRFVRNLTVISVGIPSVFSYLNGYKTVICICRQRQKVRQKFVGIYRRTSDDSDGYIIDRNVVGKSSVYTDEFPTNVTVIYLIGMSSELRRYIPTHTLWSESRRYIPTNFRRSSIFCFRRNAVGKSSNAFDDFVVRRNVRRNIACFLAVFLSFFQV